MVQKTVAVYSEKKAAVIQGDNASPLLKDLNITPGSMLDLDADGRNDIKEMPLAQFEDLHDGDINAQKIHKPALATLLEQPLQAPTEQPSTQIEYFPQENSLLNEKTGGLA
jgi:hypothetical protein